MYIRKIFIYLVFLPLLSFANVITVKDAVDREVKIQGDVNRIIALGTSLSFVTYLNSTDKLVGIEKIETQNFDKKTYSYVNKDLAKKLPIIAQGGSNKSLNYEAILHLMPDVIFTIFHNKKDADNLSKKLKIPVVVLRYQKQDKVDLDIINKSLLVAGKILGKEKRAQELVEYIASLEKDFIKPKNKKESYVGGLSYKGNQGINSTQSDFLPFKLANIKNSVESFNDSGHVFVNDEFLLTNNPSSIFIDSTGWQIFQTQFDKNKDYFKRLSAFKNNEVYVLLSNVYYYINIDQILANSFFIAKQIYKEEYASLDPIKKADDIFMHFVGIKMYKILKDSLIGFKRVKIENDKLILEDIK